MRPCHLFHLLRQARLLLSTYILGTTLQLALAHHSTIMPIPLMHPMRRDTIVMEATLNTTERQEVAIMPPTPLLTTFHSKPMLLPPAMANRLNTALNSTALYQKEV